MVDSCSSEEDSGIDELLARRSSLRSARFPTNTPTGAEAPMNLGSRTELGDRASRQDIGVDGAPSSTQGHRVDRTGPPEKRQRLLGTTPSDSWVQHIREQIREPAARVGRQLRPLMLCELCSGLCAATEAMKKVGIFQSETAMSVDPKEAAKKIGAVSSCQSSHHFNTILDVMPGTPSPCHRHGRNCEVPWSSIDIVAIGASCKPYSRQRVGRFSEPTSIVEHRDAKLLDQFIGVLSTHRPRLALFENVLGIDENSIDSTQETTWLSHWLSKIAECGYIHRVLHLNARCWLPVIRQRVYVLIVRKDSGTEDSLQQAANIVDKAITSASLDCPAPARDYFIKPGDPPWQAMQQRWQAVEARVQGNPQKEDTSWQKQSQLLRANLLAKGIQGYHLKPWTGVEATSSTRGHDRGNIPCPRARGMGFTDRRRELLDLAFLHTCVKKGVNPSDAMHKQSVRAHVATDLFCDISQNPYRRPWSTGALRCFTTSTMTYSFERDSIIDPEEAFKLHGFDAPPEGHGCSRDDLQDLVGNCMAVPCVAIALLALVCTHASALPCCFES